MAENDIDSQVYVPQQRDAECKLAGIVTGGRPEYAGRVACLLCLGIFDVHYEPGDAGPRIEELVPIPCLNDQAFGPEVRLDN